MNGPHKCQELSSLGVNAFTECRQHAIEWGLWVDMQPMEAALLAALAHIGFRGE